MGTRCRRYVELQTESLGLMKQAISGFQRTIPLLFVAVAMAAVGFWLSALPADERQGSATEKPQPHTGTVKGTVVYHADAQRPWRYARYYVKSKKTGELAEAVVALKPLAPQPQKSEPPKKPATATVDQKDFQFIPETLAIRAGDRVKFLNSDKAVHNVQTFHILHSFNVTMPAGGEHVETFEKAGNLRRPYRIGCVYHSAMRAWIFVFDHPHYQITKADGRFELKNVPPGEYELQMVHPAGELKWSKKIQVKADETETVEINVSPDNLPKRPAS